MAKLRIMSNNIWNMDDNCEVWRALGEDCSAEVRMKGIARVYGELRPGVVGLQEASHKMIDCLMTELAAVGLRYAVQWTRFTSILYRPDLFELLDSEYLLYPVTMEGYEGCFNDGRSKSLNVAVFRCKEDGHVFVLGNTHLWWKSSNPADPSFQRGSDEARVLQIGLASGLIAKYQKQYAAPAVFLGDMNCGYRAAPIQVALQSGFVHAHDAATEYASEGNGHHYCYPSGHKPYVPQPFVNAIDHILLRDAPKDAVRRFDRYTPDYYETLSDHYPVYIDAVL